MFQQTKGQKQGKQNWLKNEMMLINCALIWLVCSQPIAIGKKNLFKSSFQVDQVASRTEDGSLVGDAKKRK